MYELIRVSENCYYIQCPAKIGLVRTGDNSVCLIDSGNDKDAGKKVRRILDEQGWSLKAIYNTHSHADHTGGNRYLQDQTGCRIFAPGIERSITENPILEPALLYGGDPPSHLRHKFLMAKESAAEPLTDEVLPPGMSTIPLPGHSWDMVGFRTADDVVYLADCVSGRETLDKYKVSFLVDVGDQLDTLEKIRELKGKLFIPSHAEPSEDIGELAEYNEAKIRRIGDDILKICDDPASFDTILKRLFDLYDLEMTFEQHALVGSTIRSYLTWLTGEGKLEAFIEDRTLMWRR